MNSFYYRHFRKTDLQQIDNIFEKSIRSVKLTLIECNNIFYKWSYRYINIIFGANILFQFINYIYLFYLYFIIVLLFYISSNMYIEYYIFNTYPSMKFDTYYYKENNTMYVALDKNNVIGFVSLKCCNNNIGWMTYLFVDPIYQKKGVAKKLINKILYDFAIRHNYKFVYGGTSSLQYSAVSFYEKYAQEITHLDYYNFFVYKVIFKFII